LIPPGEVARILQKISDSLGMEVKIMQPDDPINKPNAMNPPVPPSPVGGQGGPNPSGDQTPGLNPAAAAPGAGGVPGVQPAPMVVPFNNVSSNLPHG